MRLSPGELGIPKNRSGRDASYSTPHLTIPPCDSKTGWMTQPATQALCCPWESGHGLGPLCRTGCVGVCPGADVYTAVSPSTVRCERPQMLHKPQESRAAMWSCGPLNSTGAEEPLCQDLHRGLWVLSLLSVVVGVPVGLGYNALLVLANLSSTRSMTMLDVYFVNMAMAGLVLAMLAPAHLLGPSHSGWAPWSLSSEAQVTLLILFHVAALVTMYSTALLSLDYYIERAVPHSSVASVYNTRHVCGFVWGGALLTSFSSLLFYVCSYASSHAVECAEMQSTEAADAILVLIGYVVPSLAMLYALALISHVRKEDTPLDQDVGRLDPAVHRLLVATVCTQFGLWTPYYLSLLGHTVLVSRGRPTDGHYLGVLHVARDLSKFLAFSSSSVTPLLYRCMDKAFPAKLQRLTKKVHCGRQRCSSGAMEQA